MSDKRETFNSDYYLDGIRSGLSSYQNYSWRPDLTVPMAKAWLDHLSVGFGETILDYGCARGYFVKALRELGKDAHGVDLSQWAIANCDPEIKDRVSNTIALYARRYDWINIKDVGEHIPISELPDVVRMLANAAIKGIFIIVPLTDSEGEYLREEDRRDVTHVIRWELQDWLKFLSLVAPDFQIEASYHIPGLKPASLQVPFSCGFFTMRRMR